jgi:hypothetical protein
MPTLSVVNAGFGVGNERLVVERKRRCRDLVPDLPSRRHLATLVDSVAQKLRRRALNALMVVRSSASALATSTQAAAADSAEVFLRRCAAKQQPLLSNVSSPVTRWTRGCLHPHASLPCPRSNDPSRILKPDFKKLMARVHARFVIGPVEKNALSSAVWCKRLYHQVVSHATTESFEAETLLTPAEVVDGHKAAAQGLGHGAYGTLPYLYGGVPVRGDPRQPSDKERVHEGARLHLGKRRGGLER